LNKPNKVRASDPDPATAFIGRLLVALSY
jgi:hypothetical protein